MNHERPSLELDEAHWNWVSIRGGMHSQGMGGSGNGKGRLDSCQETLSDLPPLRNGIGLTE